ncbi:elongin C [Ascoidea rubescens DSM 1968]|uniref:Elongin-C n=1 Tax=Ascoidea rubescens DSM 1968 TaxID=1344418 RepID=A0A1D2VLV6_9ASCO|nr:transcription elongation factor B polypeptide 1 [Ascoidea rubescens DSM 1968]ODV62593.1 transcription elongation factor B polypeptide 1 [Ascoidea rubescens DSM 1968]
MNTPVTIDKHRKIGVPDIDNDDERVILVSSDCHEFIIAKKAASISPTLKAMLDSSFQESKSNQIQLPDIDSQLMDVIVEYMYYNLKYKDDPSKAPKFDIPIEMLLEVLVAADYLNI